MDIAKDAVKGDITLEVQSLKVYLEERAKEMLMNANIDFQEESGFTLTGTQQKSCAC